MAVAKRSVSFEDALAARVEQAAREDGVSFSAWIAEAAQRALLLRDNSPGVGEIEAEDVQQTTAEWGEQAAAGEAVLNRLVDRAMRR